MKPSEVPPIAGARGKRVEGTLTGDGVARFMGLPYATPPIGSHRFAPATPHPGWEGVRGAHAAGPASWQGKDPIIDLIPHMDEVSGPPVAGTSEDCLTLNVWTPDVQGTLPVVVWIHGGGFLTGSSAGAWYDGARFAARHDMVFVSINYRLGLLGMLDTRYTDDPAASDNVCIALRDQLVALEWIQEDIGAFGGDSGNVTIAGESAGGASVIGLLAMPGTAEIVHRAIVQSAHAGWFLDEEASAQRTRAVLAGLHITRGAGALDDLRAVPAARFVSLRQELGFGALIPAVDGDHFPEQPLAAFGRGRAKQVPLIVGTNADETRSLRQIVGVPPVDAPFADRIAQTRAAPDLATLLRLYPSGTDDDRWDQLTADRDWHAPVRALAAARETTGSSTYVYRFEWATDAVEGRLGSSHMAEIPFALGTLPAAGPSGMFTPSIHGDPRAQAQSTAMTRAWASLCRTGDPRHALPDWRPWDADSETTMLFRGGTARAVPGLDAERLHYWQDRGRPVVPGQEH